MKFLVLCHRKVFFKGLVNGPVEPICVIKVVYQSNHSCCFICEDVNRRRYFLKCFYGAGCSFSKFNCFVNEMAVPFFWMEDVFIRKRNKSAPILRNIRVRSRSYRGPDFSSHDFIHKVCCIFQGVIRNHFILSYYFEGIYYYWGITIVLFVIVFLLCFVSLWVVFICHAFQSFQIKNTIQIF